MVKRKFKSGDIFQILLPNELGFAYAKGINLLEIHPDTRYPVIIHIYNYRSIIPEIPVDQFLNKELILCPLLIAGIIPAINNGTYKIIENIPITDKDMIIPDYKVPEPDEENVKDWYYVKDANISRKFKSEYESVKHLETLGAVGSDLVRTKIAMALLLDEGKRVEDYFKLDIYFEKKFHKDIIEIPAYYKQPKSIRGKAVVL